MAIKLQEQDFDLIKSLVTTPGLPGREALITEKISQAIPSSGWEINQDPVGNLTARKSGQGKKLLFIAHMDEVGLIVRRITDDGFLKVERLGGIGVHVLPGSSMELWTSKGKSLEALVGAPSAHLVNGRSQDIEIEDLYIDIGAHSKEEARALGVNIGDGLTWKSDLQLLNGTRIRGKALDDRLGCFALIKVATLLGDIEQDYDIMVAFVVQEEAMLLEAAPIVRVFEPDIVIGVDGTLPFDTPDIDEPQSDLFLGKGPCIKLMDAIRGKIAYLPSWDLTRTIIRYMDESGFVYQPEVVIGLSTAVSLVPFMNSGVKTACFSLPIRYHHSAVELADVYDLERLIEIMIDIIRERVL